MHLYETATLQLYAAGMNRVDRRKQELRERILTAAYELFLDQGVSTTTIEDICERADVANRTFFNHFATRQEMLQALADRRLTALHEVVFDGSSDATPVHLIKLFDTIAAEMVQLGDNYRAVVGAMVSATGYGIPRGSSLHSTFFELVKTGVAAGDVATAHDPLILADIIVGTLSGAIINWATDHTYSLTSNMHDLADALADLLSGSTGKAVATLRQSRRRTSSTKKK
jgi:AcrR family transcriptional regulator